MDAGKLHGRKAATRFRLIRTGVMLGMVVALSNTPPDYAGGDGFRMASAGPRFNCCDVGASSEERGAAAYVRTVAAGFSPYGEPAAGVLFATLTLAPASRRRRRTGCPNHPARFCV